MNKFARLLLVEDTPSLARTYQAHLKDVFETIDVADCGARALEFVAKNPPTCVLLDLKLPDMDGLQLLDRWVEECLPAPVIVVTANGSLSVAVDAMRRGAVDFVVKPTSSDRLRATVRNALETFQLKKIVQATENKVDESGFFGIVGQSRAMQRVYRTIEAAAPSKASIFITGETGTGKELAARAIHDSSPRRNARFVAVNCGAIPKNLIESEIFGHVKGAFTGATSDREGAAQLAEGGTLFLDELGEMPIDLQPKLLRFLQSGEFSRVGESRTRIADIRIVAATNRDPLGAVQQGRLREDLYYRLHVVPLPLPALRERGADILQLAEHFLDRFSHEEGKQFRGFDRQAQEWIVSHTWYGNVRELENLIRHVVVLHSGEEVSRDMLPIPNSVRRPVNIEVNSKVDRSARFEDDDHHTGVEPLWLTEKRAIERAIAMNRGNVVAAAKALQINPSTIYRKKISWDDTASPGPAA